MTVLVLGSPPPELEALLIDLGPTELAGQIDWP